MKEIDSTESPASVQHPHQRFSHAWRALRHRNFRLFFAGQNISLIGTWMTRVATSWLIYPLTGSALLMRPIYVEMGIIRSNLEPAMEDHVGR